jgi:hypothetical protein
MPSTYVILGLLFIVYLVLLYVSKTKRNRRKRGFMEGRKRR